LRAVLFIRDNLAVYYLLEKGRKMGNVIVLAIVALIVVAIIRALRKEHRENGSCAYCSYAKSGKCDHVGHEELDHMGQEFHLTKEQQAIIDRHTRNRKKA
jgi:hypothetical protein